MATSSQSAILEAEDESERIEMGQRPPRTPNDSETSSIIVASYNIRYAVGRFLIASGLLRHAGLNLPRRRTEAIQQNLRTAAQVFSNDVLLPRVDILALQEADKRTSRAGGVHIAAELARELHITWAHVGAGIPRGEKPKQRQWWLNFEEQIGLFDEGDTGIALLSRLSLENVTRIDLPWHECKWRPRLAMGATVILANQPLRILNAHVDPHASIDGQHDQLEVLVQQAQAHEGPAIVLGDFNTLSNQKCLETRRFMESHGFSSPLPTGTATWRGGGLRMHADWIFVREVAVKRWGVARPLNVSDHWPIWAEVAVRI